MPNTLHDEFLSLIKEVKSYILESSPQIKVSPPILKVETPPSPSLKPLIKADLSEPELKVIVEAPQKFLPLTQVEKRESVDCKDMVELIRKVSPNLTVLDAPLVEETLFVAILIFKEEERQVLESLQKALNKENIKTSLIPILGFIPTSETRLVIATSEGIMGSIELQKLAKRDPKSQILFFAKTPSLIIPDICKFGEQPETKRAFWQKLLGLLKTC